MKKTAIAAAIAAVVALPSTAGAYEIIGKHLEVYGKAHVSVDFADNDRDSAVAIASNSSRLGFKGVTAVSDQLDVLYQIESKIVFDEGGANFAGRNTYVGLGGDFGKVLIGNQDTPFKGVRGTFDLFGDTVGDARNLLGVYAVGTAVSDIGNRRAKNSIQYLSPSIGGFAAKAMYSSSYNDTELPGGIEDNDFDLYSVSGSYKLGGLTLAAGYERANSALNNDESDGYRLAANYKFNAFTLGAIAERIERGNIERDAYGINGAFSFGPNKLKLQYVYADEIDGIDDSDASQLTLGFDHKLGKKTTLYAAYNLLDNNDAAGYRIKGGHDTDVYEVNAVGDDVSAFSIGLVHSF
ncbi:porin [Alkalilimnicola sp. S0819]|uniref:porin n=1 Tax=Alkalilimnicola sp. S0819 TaxID=2613922 RepID=UPI0012629BB5|nr:porin [Alkalilimnicola sp. S0819]KAB7623176.1 porin [Alkalilimnicola sp. S0819]MPQ17020.1 porin [Alkalilimnicola sp. S0819]